jgi:hypothetical protein
VTKTKKNQKKKKKKKYKERRNTLTLARLIVHPAEIPHKKTNTKQ